jgi:predicted MPP superfamily phosphohydrolase
MRRLILIGIFISILLGVVVGGHLYLVRRLIVDPMVPQPAAGYLQAFILSAAAILIFTPIGERILPRSAAQLIAWPASIWMGLTFYLLILMILSDLTWVLLGATVADGTGSMVAAARGRAVGVALLALTIGGIGLRTVLRGPTVKRLEIRLPRWPRALDGFCIVQISDIHISTIVGRRFAQSLVDRINALSPDLIAVTGDLVDGDVRHIGDEITPFAGLRARHGAFFVTGNHDHYSGADAWVNRVEQLGLQPLRNRHVTVEADGATFDLAGVEDHHAHLVSGRHREDVGAALRGRDATRPVVLMAHDPATFPEAARHGVDLQLSGHTHGGQIWPFRYFVRLATPYVAGLFSAGASQLYVSRGTGFWGPPMRFLAPAEITEIHLHSGGGEVESRQ